MLAATSCLISAAAVMMLVTHVLAEWQVWAAKVMSMLNCFCLFTLRMSHETGVNLRGWQ